jgi:hypothetical protein
MIVPSDGQDVVKFIRKADLSLLGNSITSLPVSQWRDRMLFAGAPDQELKFLTGTFPRTFRTEKTTHPIFVLASMQTGMFVCPCSTKGNPSKFRFIRSGCRLKDGREETLEQPSYLVETCSFTLPMDRRFSRKLIYLGVVPETCIADDRGEI